ncbi:MAG: hypothetical protein Q3X03_06400, partial [Eggerthellaceae bacterium]|nr:hypothetical protein [Eggerthellaceae bacterium]
GIRFLLQFGNSGGKICTVNFSRVRFGRFRLWQGRRHRHALAYVYRMIAIDCFMFAAFLRKDAQRAYLLNCRQFQ